MILADLDLYWLFGTFHNTVGKLASLGCIENSLVSFSSIMLPATTSFISVYLQTKNEEAELSQHNRLW